MAIIIGKSVYFGLGFPKERLPQDWNLIESCDDWARATSPDGQKHILSLTHAYKIITPGPGDLAPRIDFKNPIPLHIPEP